MKKCPYCAEEILDEAKKCKFCGEWIDKDKYQDNLSEAKKNNQIKPPAPLKDKKNLKIIVWAFLGIIGTFFWYISIPVIMIWYIFKKTELKNKNKWKLAFLTLFVFAITVGILSYINRTPTIIIKEPVNNFSTQSDKVIIKGVVDPKNSEVRIGSMLLKTENGDFLHVAFLNQEQNNFILTAKNGNKTANASLSLKRIYTQEEKAELEKKKQEEKIKAEKKAKEDAQKAKEEAKRKLEAERKTYKITERKKSVERATALSHSDNLGAWRIASYSDRIKLCEFMVSRLQEPNLTASSLCRCITETAGDGGLDSIKISEIASACTVLLK